MLSRIDYNKVYGVVKWFLPFYLFTFYYYPVVLRE